MTPHLSVVIPVHDEVETLPLLLPRVGRVLAGLAVAAEIIVVDDASTDGSAALVRELAARDPRLRLVRLRRHAGITAAFDAGFKASRGEIIVTLDADLQNDPDDIPALLARLADADLVVGWRRGRRDPWLKRVSSRVGNAARRAVTGSAVRDGASSLRAMRRRCLEPVPLVDGMHRFLPTLAEAAGCRVVEVPVRHHPRRHGRSKFGVRNRAWRTLVDLLAVRWLIDRQLAYVATEDGRVIASMPAPVPRRARTWRSTAAALAVVWLGVAAVLGLWNVSSAPSAPSLVPDASGAVAIAPRAGRILSVWVWWDARHGRDGWLALEHGAARSPAELAFWQRRVHPGWNLLTWSDVPSGALALKRVAGQPEAWGIAPPTGAERYGVEHLARFSGLAAALALAMLVLIARAASALARRPAPGRWAWSVALITALALALRLPTLSTTSLWLDEVLTAIGAQSFTWVLYSPQIFGHPPLQYLVAWALTPPGAGELALRLPFVLAGTATVPLVAVLGRTLFGGATGAVAALVLAVSPLHVELSQTMRSYALLLLFTAVALLALLDGVRRDRAASWLLFSASAALALYTHYIAVVVIALLAVALAAARPRAGWRSAIVSFAGIAVLAMPWTPVLARLVASHGTGGDLPAAALTHLVVHAWLPQFLGPGRAGVLAVALVALGVLALRRRAGLAVAALLAPLVVLWLAQPAHFVAGRHLAFLLPALALLMAHGVTAVAGHAGALSVRLARVRPRAARLVAAAVGATLLVSWSAPVAGALRHYYSSRQSHDWRSVAALVDEHVTPADRVVATVAAAYPLRYYWGDGVDVLDGTTALDDLAPNGSSAVWIVTAPGGPWPAGLDSWLDTNAVRVAEVPASWSLPGVRVYRVPPR
ncbi:MAG: glycosyltransferase [Candidatus Rokubacteria bacterium]|nr:glycosyltransferase [Candidatus Rokubacteria bacterium]